MACAGSGDMRSRAVTPPDDVVDAPGRSLTGRPPQAAAASKAAANSTAAACRPVKPAGRRRPPGRRLSRSDPDLSEHLGLRRFGEEALAPGREEQLCVEIGADVPLQVGPALPDALKMTR